MESYGRVLERYREERGVSQRGLAREVGLSHVLVNRSEKGERPPAGPEEIGAIARALELTDEQRDRMLASAGYWPAAFLALGPSDETLGRVAGVLADPSVPEAARSELRRAVEALASLAALTRPAGR